MRYVIYCDIGGFISSGQSPAIGRRVEAAAFAPCLIPPGEWPPPWLGDDGQIMSVVAPEGISPALLCASLRELAADIERGYMPTPNVPSVRAWEVEYTGTASV
jgi:hypothetical protein